MIIRIFLGIIAIFFISSRGLAHPPDSVKISFDMSGTVLTVQAFHPVKNITNHLIFQISVDLNGKQMISQNFSSQLNKIEQVAIYKIIDAKKNDKITVTVQCNVSGKKNKDLFIN